MPSPPSSFEIRTLTEFTAKIEVAVNDAVSAPWYRGCGKSTYELVPTLYRHPTITSIEQFVEYEANLITRFKQRSVPYLARDVGDNWEHLFLMQHFGVPTRLLDWTENPYVALFFAIKGANYTINSGLPEYLADASIWILDPSLWNRKVFNHISYEGGALSVTDRSLVGYAPGTDINTMNNEAVAIYGTHNSPRIVAQRGVFTVFGKELSPMEVAFQQSGFPEETLVKLVFPKSALLGLKDSLYSIGITESVVFPDLDGLGQEIRREYGFEV